jgi:transposase
MEAALWIARTGSPWRDLPPLFGKWNTVIKRYRDWVKADVFKRLFDASSEDPDMEYASPSMNEPAPADIPARARASIFVVSRTV